MNPRKVQVEKFQKLGKKHNMPVGGMFHYQWGENRITGGEMQISMFSLQEKRGISKVPPNVTLIEYHLPYGISSCKCLTKREGKGY